MTTFFSQGFRPFFLGAAVWAVLGMVLWTLIYRGDVTAEFAWEVRDWHAHEMLFGYVSAVIAGFLLTAVPNWTGIAAPKGGRLVALFGLWVLGRLVMFFSASLPPLFVGLIDVSFLVVLDIWLIKVLLESGNKRNLVVAGIIGLFIVSNVAMHLRSFEEIGEGGGLLAVIMLISLIGGRVVPAFTRNWLASQGSRAVVAEFGTPDKVALATTALALILFAMGVEGAALAVVFAAASLATLWRLSRWQGRATFGEPLVWIMHLAYLWVPIGFALMALSQVTDFIAPYTALHGLTTGAVGTMTLAIMTRASLGHMGRPLAASRATVVIYILITSAAIFRVGADAFGDPVLAYSIAGFAWAAAFMIFAIVYGAMFVKSQSP
jgi:uncharacterized protein involved in response to NO